jgi:hypothetical protein
VSYPQSEKHSGFDPIVGDAKDPNIMTYYAVRLSAKAKILFSPYGDLTLTAYAAAQPFGSRIGPPESEAIFSAPGVPDGGVSTRCTATTCVERLPNIPMKENDSASTSMTSGWAQNDILYHLYTGALGVASGGAGAVQL